MTNLAFQKNKHFLLLFCLGFAIVNCFAQTEKQKSSKSSYGKFSANYLTNSVYNGRQDSLLTPYFTPELAYYNKSGFYISSSFSYLSSANESRIDLFSFDAGYDFSITDKLSSSVYASKSFYNQNSSAIKSGIKGSVGMEFSYDFDAVQLDAGTDILFSEKPDIAFNIGLGHDFSFGENENEWSIKPAVAVNFSTLHFYEGFTNRKAGKKAKQLIPNLSSIQSVTTVENNKLTLLDYELSLPVTYDNKKWGAFFTATFAIPQNPITTTTVNTIKLTNGTQYTQTTNSTPQSEKSLKNSAYVEFGFYLKF